MTTPRIIALGQRAAGDDGVGAVVLEAIEELRQGPVDTFLIRTAAGLPRLLEEGDPIIIVDAVVGEAEPGKVLVLTADELAEEEVRPVSSHGLTVSQALMLAHNVRPIGSAPAVRLVGITIEHPTEPGFELSEPVAAAVPEAASIALELATGRRSGRLQRQ